jgi:hypothetical protein
VRAAYIVNGFPLTKTPFDGGGPTAQAAVATGLGKSIGYAAAPDPGVFFASGGGLAAGALGGGVPGVLPPITGLPSPPDYPFLVRTDANTNPEQSVGQDPVRISAKSEPSKSQSQATFGTDHGGAVSTASVAQAPDGSGIATGVADLHGVTAGPVTLGHVVSTATRTIKADGTAVHSTSLEVDGAEISGTPVSFGPDGFSSLNSASSGVLKSSGIEVRFVAAQDFPESGRVIAPGIMITMPIPESPQIPGLGQFSGTATYFIGFATAEITPPGGVPTSASTGTSVTTSAASAGTSPSAVADAAGSPVAAMLNLPVQAPSATGVGVLPETTSPSTTTLLPTSAEFQPVAAELGGLDLRSSYLLGIAAAIVAAVAGLRLGRRGVGA